MLPHLIIRALKKAARTGSCAILAGALLLGSGGGAFADASEGMDNPGLGPWDSLRARLLVEDAAKDVSLTMNYDLAWLDALPVREGGAEWRCLTEALYFEARGETIRGQFAVAEVILNRMSSRRFPNTVCAVINQGTGARYRCQFTYTCDGRPEIISERAAWERVGKVAYLMLQGVPRLLTKGATFYHTTGVSPSWSRQFEQTAQYGVHVFYRRPTQLSSN